MHKQPAMMMIHTTFSPDNVPTMPNFSPISYSETKSLPKRRGVSFFPKVFVLRTIHRQDYTAAELRRTWYTMDELKMMKRFCRKLARDFSNPTTNASNNTNNGTDENGDCLRGLEGRTTSGLIRRKVIKSNAREAVFREQRRQRQFGILYLRQIADAYFDFTEFPQMTAHMVGLHDEKDAKALHNNNNNNNYYYNKQITTTTAITAKITSGDDQRRKSMVMYARRDSMRSMKSLTAFTSTKRILTAAFLKV